MPSSSYHIVGLWEKIGGRPGYNSKARVDETIRRVVGYSYSYVGLCDPTQTVGVGLHRWSDIDQ